MISGLLPLTMIRNLILQTAPISMPKKYTQKQLQEAVKFALQEPHIPTIHIAESYGVDRKTLCRRVLGTYQERNTAHRSK